MQVPLYRHNLINEDTEALGKKFGEMLSGMMISTGPVNKEVSEKFAAYMERKHCLLTSSWSGGMQATLLALGIKPNDEVIIPAMTFAATANIIEVLGAKPVLVDIKEDTKLIDFTKIVPAITERTKAVIPVHLYGQMVDMKKLRELIPSHIHIIEDAAHAIESMYNGYRPGTYSNAAVFSFYQSKNMTTGEGGAIVTDDEKLYNKIKLTYRHGVDLCGYQRHIREEFIAPDVVTAGIKANMPDILAIMLPPQIERAEQNLHRRQEIAKRYMRELNGLVSFPVIDPLAKTAWHIFAIGVDPNKREKALVYLYNNGVRTTIHFKSMHMTSYYNSKYGYYPTDFPNAYYWGESVFSLPIFPGLTEEEQTHVIEQVKLSLA
jgi:UDP-4-amino-4-deoxy-L-arabinose-oxoglutarate aminotransferase